MKSIPIQGSTGAFCFDNVERKVRKSGGSIAYGWAIWNLPSFYFEAEHHAVWRNKQGNLIDVSPQLSRRRRMLFLQDDTAVYDPNQPRQNFLAPDGITQAARQMVDLGHQRNSLIMRCRIAGTPEIRLFEADQVELAKINYQIQAILTQ